jgi:hypothetical protein
MRVRLRIRAFGTLIGVAVAGVGAVRPASSQSIERSLAPGDAVQRAIASGEVLSLSRTWSASDPLGTSGRGSIHGWGGAPGSSASDGAGRPAESAPALRSASRPLAAERLKVKTEEPIEARGSTSLVMKTTCS